MKSENKKHIILALDFLIVYCSLYRKENKIPIIINNEIYQKFNEYNEIINNINHGKIINLNNTFKEIEKSFIILYNLDLLLPIPNRENYKSVILFNKQMASELLSSYDQKEIDIIKKIIFPPDEDEKSKYKEKIISIENYIKKN